MALTGRLTTKVTAAYTAKPGEVVVVDTTGGAVSITLPTVGYGVGNGEVTIIKGSVDANAVTIVGTVNGAVNPTLAAQYNSKTVISDGGVWLTLAST